MRDRALEEEGAGNYYKGSWHVVSGLNRIENGRELARGTVRYN